MLNFYIKIRCSPELSLTHEMALVGYLFVEFLFNKNECAGNANKNDAKTEQSNIIPGLFQTRPKKTVTVWCSS